MMNLAKLHMACGAGAFILLTYGLAKTTQNSPPRKSPSLPPSSHRLSPQQCLKLIGETDCLSRFPPREERDIRFTATCLSSQVQLFNALKNEIPNNLLPEELEKTQVQLGRQFDKLSQFHSRESIETVTPQIQSAMIELYKPE